MKRISTVLVCLTAASLLAACQKPANAPDASNTIDLAESEKITAPAETEELFSPSDVWAERLELPTAQEIEKCNSTSTQRSPYIGGWLKNDKATRFTQYSADIKADYLPYATYLSPVNLTIDYSSLKDQYINVWNEDGTDFQRKLPLRGENPARETLLLSF